jgi:hypothetical protein
MLITAWALAKVPTKPDAATQIASGKNFDMIPSKSLFISFSSDDRNYGNLFA